MNWKYKAALQTVFSNVPFGEPLNYLFQKHVTRNVPAREEEFRTRVGLARRHIELALRHGQEPLAGRLFYEFGAGKDLLGPLMFYALGVDRQVLVDLRRLARPELVNDTVLRLQRLAPRIGLPRSPARTVGRSAAEAIAALKQYYGIEYHAPADARRSSLESGSVNCITTTNTMEHIPSEDILRILPECRRILRDDGVMIFRIDYQDHYSYFDGNISVYHFLRYPESAWKWVNASLHYQNRLRHRDHLELFAKSGFAVSEDCREGGSAADLETLAGIPLDERFRSYTPAELAVRFSYIVLRKG